MYDLLTSINQTFKLQHWSCFKRLSISKQFLQLMINDYFLNAEHLYSHIQ